MDFLNAILTFPGKIIANLLFDYLRVVWMIVLAGIVCLVLFHFLYKKRGFFHIALILSSILLAFTPSAFKFASYDSKLFWVFIFSSAGIGFIYYFINKEGGLTTPSIVQKNNQAADAVPTQMDPAAILRNRTTEESVFYRNRHLFLLVLLFVLAFYLRTFQIEQYPAGYSYHELFLPIDLVQYDEGKLGLKSFISLFKAGQVNSPNQSPIIMGVAFPFYKIFGISLVTGRYFSVVWGMVGLLFLFLYLREYFPINPSIFLVSFTSLEIVNATFARTGFIFIVAFTYTAFLLYLMEITFKQRKLYFSVLLAFFFGLAVFLSNYLYLATKAAILIVIIILVYKVLFKKAYLGQNMIPLAVFFLTFSLAVYWYTGGNVKNLWPSYADYISPNRAGSLIEFIKTIFETWGNNFKITFNRIVFIERAVDSLSKFKDGGLISGLTLCFIPFAMGYGLAGIRRERYFSIIIIILVALLPGILSGVPNSRRLLLFLSFLLVLPGMTVYLLFNQIQTVLSRKMKEFAVLIPALFFVLLFSYNLNVFIDINNDMIKMNSVIIPFADSGFGDMRYSRYTTALAKEIKEFIKYNNIYFYYSNVFEENATNPNGTYEQFSIESYNNSKKGGKITWMNQFRGTLLSGNNIYFYKFDTALKMILDSDRNAKVIFIKPLADEINIYEKLKAFFPNSMAEERLGDNNEDKFYVLSISHSEIDNVNGQKLVSAEFSSETLSHLLKENVRSDFSFDGYFLLQSDSNILFKNNITGLFEIIIDEYKLTEQTNHLSLLKGVHRVKIKPADKEPFAIINANSGKFQDFSAPFITASEAMKHSKSNTTEFYPYLWIVEKTIPYDSFFLHAFSYYSLEDGQYVYSHFNQLFNASGQSLMLDNSSSIIKILKKEGTTFTLQYFDMEHGQFAVYDSNYKKIKGINLNGYPFDLFFGNRGELYITYLNREKITIFQPDYVEETWDTSTFSRYPIWNGAIDENGDIILLSGDGKVFVFDKMRKLYSSFKVDVSWSNDNNGELIRSGGGIVISNGIIHILDSLDNSIKSYSKNGHQLYNDTYDSLFIVPPNFKIDFMQKFNDRIILISREGQKRILIYKQVKEKIKAGDGRSLSLLQFKPSEVSVGWAEYLINSGPPRFLQRVNNERYENFIFAHAPSHATYHLRALFESLSVGYGLDDMDGHDTGSVKFIIKGDGRLLYTSKVIRAFDPIERVKIDVIGVDQLELITDPTEDGKAYDQSVWINPILQVQTHNKVQP